MIIRNESESDYEAIFCLTKAAFEDHPYSQHTEQFIINALRADNALSLSLVAEVNEKVVGHVAFSAVKISDGTADWYGLGPVSVLPEFQGQGIGKALINEGLKKLEALGAEGCVLVGEPKYYERFGFKNNPELTLEGVPQMYFLSLSIKENHAHGSVEFHKGFEATS